MKLLTKSQEFLGIKLFLSLEIWTYIPPNGCTLFWQCQNFQGYVPAFHVNTVDTTGAGDSFIGALLCKMVKDQSIIEVTTTTTKIIINISSLM